MRQFRNTEGLPLTRISQISLFLFCVIFVPQSSADDELDGADEYIVAAMKHWDVKGAAIAVVKDGEVVLAKGYGVRNAGTKAFVDTTTLFNIASCTKSFTAASVAALVDQGKLDWDDPVSKHLPKLRFSDEYMTQHATLRDLLCHRTGLQRADLIFTLGHLKRDELLERITWLKPQAAFRTKLTYSNVMYAVLGEVVASTANQSWKEFVKVELFEPLEMHSTTFSIGKKDRPKFAPRHWRDEGNITSRRVPVYDATAAGGIYSTADDMAKWLQFQLTAGRVSDRQVISEQAIREMHAMQHSIPVLRTPKDNPYAARFYGFGLGWVTLDYRGRKLVMHTGAWGAVVALVPEENLGVVVLSNLDWNGMAGMLMYRVLDSYCSDSESVWRTDNFKQFDSEGPGHAYRSRDRERAELEAFRAKESKPVLPPAEYAGQFRSSLFGDLQVLQKDERLSLMVGPFTTELMHWENDVFYAKAPTRMNYDWLVQFDVKHGGVHEVTLKYVGWHEPDAVFQRVSERK